MNLIWKFEPKRITYDFAQGNIKAINTVFGNKNENIILNLKLLQFMAYINAIEFYKKIKDSYKTDFVNFFEYFEDTWLNKEDESKSKYPFSLWKYEGKTDLESSRAELISKKS